jgi:hypothetical protein
MKQLCKPHLISDGSDFGWMLEDPWQSLALFDKVLLGCKHLVPSCNKRRKKFIYILTDEKVKYDHFYPFLA